MKLSDENNELRILTIDELREFSGFENVSEEKAIEIIGFLKDISLLAHKTFMHNESNERISNLRKKEQQKNRKKQ